MALKYLDKLRVMRGQLVAANAHIREATRSRKNWQRVVVECRTAEENVSLVMNRLDDMIEHEETKERARATIHE